MAIVGSVAGLLKIGEREHIARLQKLGHLHMRPLWKFAQERVDSSRGDAFEGSSFIWQPDVAELQMEVDGEFRMIPGIGGPIRYASRADRETNVFCVYAIREFETPILFDRRNGEFGRFFAYITHVEEFLHRVEAAIPKGRVMRHGVVEYVDTSRYTGPMEAFRKRRDYEHQCEYRVAVTPGDGDDLDLYLGDLSDIVEIGCTEQIAGVRVRVIEA